MSPSPQTQLLWWTAVAAAALVALLWLLRAYSGGALALELMGSALPGCL